VKLYRLLESFVSGERGAFIATKSVQRAEGHEVQLSSRTIFAKGKKEGSPFGEPLEEYR
jgi:hypothetical protein